MFCTKIARNNERQKQQSQIATKTGRDDDGDAGDNDRRLQSSIGISPRTPLLSKFGETSWDAKLKARQTICFTSAAFATASLSFSSSSIFVALGHAHDFAIIIAYESGREGASALLSP